MDSHEIGTGVLAGVGVDVGLVTVVWVRPVGIKLRVGVEADVNVVDNPVQPVNANVRIKSRRKRHALLNRLTTIHLAAARVVFHLYIIFLSRFIINTKTSHKTHKTSAGTMELGCNIVVKVVRHNLNV
jgi:hypothetical protein